MTLFLKILGLSAFASYRRVIGLVALFLALLIDQVFCNIELSTMVPFFATACTVGGKFTTILGVLGTWAGIAGVAGAKKGV